MSFKFILLVHAFFLYDFIVKLKAQNQNLSKQFSVFIVALTIISGVIIMYFCSKRCKLNVFT